MASLVSPRSAAARAVGIVLALLLCAVVTQPATAAAATRVIRVPVDSRLYLPCANGGAGEVVHFTGMILGVSSGGPNAAGGFHAVSVEVEQGVHGVGETSGDRYVEHFVNLFMSTSGPGGYPLTSTQQLIYRIDSSGAGVDSAIRLRSHTTIDANGVTTVSTGAESMDCLAQEP